MKLIAIGDIHGQFDNLIKLTDILLKDYSDHKIVFLGDYVDKGNKSAEVLDYLISLKNNHGNKIKFLAGNHEVMFLSAITNFEHPNTSKWIKGGGGLETLESYGWDRFDPFNLSMIPIKHKQFLEDLDLLHETKNAIFVHAGLNPNKKLSEQSPKDLLWIREKFNNSKKQWNKTIIHGHTPQYKKFPVISKYNRINLDMGAGTRGDIGAIIINKDELKFIVSSKKGLREKTLKPKKIDNAYVLKI